MHMNSWFYLILGLGYLCLISLWIKKSAWFNGFPLRRATILKLYGFKIIAGWAYGLIHQHFYNGGDTFAWYRDGLFLYKSLFSHPGDFVRLVFGPNNTSVSASLWPYIETMGYWGDTPAYFIVRLNAIFNIFSFGNYYINVIFFNIFSLAGALLLFKFLVNILRAAPSLLKLSCLWLPTVVFWSSGIHKDGIILFSIGLLLWGYDQIIRRHSNLKTLFAFTLGLYLTFLVRDYLLFLLVPALVGLHTGKLYPRFIPLNYLTVYGLVFVLSAILPLPFFNQMTALEIIAYKQSMFNNLFPGNTTIDLAPVATDLWHFLWQFPRAIWNTLILPGYYHLNSWHQWIAAIENWFICSVLLLTLFRLRFIHIQNNGVVFSLLFALSLLIIIGLIVPNTGAIVRYRMLAMPFLLATSFHILGRRVG